MRRLLYHEERAGPVILYPLALIGGFLVAYGWWLFLVGIILPVFATVVGADLELASRNIRQHSPAGVPSRGRTPELWSTHVPRLQFLR